MKNHAYLLLLLLIISILGSGCTDQKPSSKTQLLTVNSTSEIHDLLRTSPVFIQLGADWCPSCQNQKPILEELAARYHGQVEFIYINIDQQRELSKYFDVYYIPDICMIVRSDNGKFVYVTRYGTLTDNRQDAMMVGLTSKEVLDYTIQNGLRLRNLENIS